ncbi:hypothetical protein [Hymenobacter sp. IS2118]|uniref:hypothetical protein n=1 Tax=Hymenobacter sp. IS2118 TaxID=1505605 RepID=UPI000558B6DD|nr:hypothetical protein [Hymenobacter sp. IS2118]
MNNYRRSLLGLLLLLLPLLALKCDKEDVIKANQFDVKVRVTGDNLFGLGAEMKVESRRNVLNPKAGPSLSKAFSTSINQTYDLGTFGIQDDVTISALFRQVTCNSMVQPVANTKLKVELLVNGVVLNVVELTPASKNTSGFSCNPFWLATTIGSGDDWD